MTHPEPIQLISDEALAELTRMAEELTASRRQYEQWCARHGYRRGSFLPGRMDAMYEADRAEALAENRRHDLLKKLMRRHPFVGDGAWCEHWSATTEAGDRLAAGSRCGWARDLHPTGDTGPVVPDDI